MISLRNAENVKKAIEKMTDAALHSAKQASAECEAEIMAKLYGDEYEASGGIELDEDLIKREFGSEDNPPSPIIETALTNSSSALQGRFEEIFKREMEEG